MKHLGVGLNLALLKDNQSGDPELFSFSKRYYDCLLNKNKVEDFLCQTLQNIINLNILSLLGKPNTFVHSLAGLQSRVIV